MHRLLELRGKEFNASVRFERHLLGGDMSGDAHTVGWRHHE